MSYAKGLFEAVLMACAVSLVVGALIGVVSTAIIRGTSCDTIKHEAVSKGYAEYYITPKKEVGWRWKEAQP